MDARIVSVEAKIKTAMGEDWVHIKRIELQAKISRATAFRNMRRLLGEGRVTRRPYKEGSYGLKLGYEWKWVGEAPQQVP